MEDKRTAREKVAQTMISRAEKLRLCLYELTNLINVWKYSELISREIIAATCHELHLRFNRFIREKLFWLSSCKRVFNFHDIILSYYFFLNENLSPLSRSTAHRYFLILSLIYYCFCIRKPGPRDSPTSFTKRAEFRAILILPVIKTSPLTILTHNTELLFARAMYTQSRAGYAPYIRVYHFLHLRIFITKRVTSVNILYTVYRSICKICKCNVSLLFQLLSNFLLPFPSPSRCFLYVRSIISYRTSMFLDPNFTWTVHAAGPSNYFKKSTPNLFILFIVGFWLRKVASKKKKQKKKTTLSLTLKNTRFFF